MTTVTVNGIPVASGAGTCYEQGFVLKQTDLGGGVLLNTRQAPSPRRRTAVFSDITQAEAQAIAAVATNGAIVYLTGDFVPPAAALGHALFFTAKIDGTSGRGVAILTYETFFLTDSSGEIWTETFL